jgi:exopolyphosphatase/pppGpp-phosphohydrolase
MSSGTFAAFSKIHLNTSKYTFMKVVHLVEGHNFHVDWHFKFGVEIGEKLDRLSLPPVHRDRPAFKVGTTFLQNPLRKTLYGFCESCRG